MGNHFLFTSMRIIRTILQIAILYIFYYIGVLIVELTHLPLPASVIGLLVLFVCLQLKWIKVEYIKEGAGFLIAFMTLFFIPPMIGIIEYPQLLSVKGLILIGTVIFSTIFVIYFTGVVSQKIEKKELEIKEKKALAKKALEMEEKKKAKGGLDVENNTLRS